jgi:uncharacterized membrane protein YoaK (UPF0700 family)
MVVGAALKKTFPADIAVLLLALNGGYVDAMSFLALHGLFAAHVTGNFVTLGSSLALGTTGVAAKLIALPVFCMGVVAARLLRYRLQRRDLPILQSLLLIQFALLSIAAVIAVDLGPFADGDGIGALVTGMTLVSATAIQNATHRVHFPKSPPSTLMTGTTTQIMLDVADLIHGVSGDAREATKTRMWHLGRAVLVFAAGCAAAAVLYALFREQSFWAPPVFALLALVSAPRDAEQAASPPARSQ